MKKLILSAVVIIVSGCGCLWAQTSAIKITADKIRIEKPLSADLFTFQLKYCGLTIKTGFSTGEVIKPEPIPIGGTTSTLNNIENVSNSISFFGAIIPEVSNFMDLGSSDKYFRYSYVYQPYHKSASRLFSDARYKENIKDLETASQIIRQLHPVSFDFKKTEPNEDTASLKNKVGFIAQEMLEVLPHLVGQLPGTDIYTVDYTSVIPYLVKAFQEAREEKAALEEQTTELQEQVSELRDQLASLQEIVQSLLAQNENVNASSKNNTPKNSPKNPIQEAKLFQNLPNPFSETAIIRYELPQTAGNAYLQVFDMSGRMLRNIALPHAQEIGQVEISAGELTPGAYTYSLVVSGKVADSKRMVVTQ